MLLIKQSEVGCLLFLLVPIRNQREDGEQSSRNQILNNTTPLKRFKSL